MNDETTERLRQQHEALVRGIAFSQLIGLAGWLEVESFFKTWLARYRKSLRDAATSEPAAALDALRRYQLAEELFSLITGYIETSIEEARIISGTRTTEEALLMEKLKNEQPESTEPESRPDPAGY